MCDNGVTRESVFFSKSDFDDHQLGWRANGEGPKLVIVRIENKSLEMRWMIH